MRCYHVLVFLLFAAVSCTKEPQYINTSKASDNLFIVQTDTLQPAYRVYRLDSFQTSGTNRSLIGKITDPYFGVTRSQSFCRFVIAPDGYLTIGTQSESYDSIALIMRTDHTYSGDTTLPWTVSVHGLAADLNAVYTYYYNYQQIPALDQELGTLTKVIRPNADDSVRVRLTDSLGAAIWNLYVSKNESVSSGDAFQRYFKGLRLSGDSADAAIYGFNAADSGTYIRLYYHDDVGTKVNKYLDFKSQASNYQFNNITTDPTGTITEAVIAGHDTPSTALDHQIFVNDLAGIGTRFTLPAIKTVAALPDFVKLQAAQLKVVPVPGSFSKWPLPPTLGIGVSNQTSSGIAPLGTPTGTGAQTGNLTIDELNGTGTGYSYDLTTYSQSEIAATAYTTTTVYFEGQYFTNGYKVGMQRLVAADNANVKSPSKVTLQMLFFKK